MDTLKQFWKEKLDWNLKFWRPSGVIGKPIGSEKIWKLKNVISGNHGFGY